MQVSADPEMSHAEFQEPPRKKPRFFAEDPPSPPLDETLHGESTLPDEVNALSEAQPNLSEVGSLPAVSNAIKWKEGDGFNVELFSSIVGEELSASSLTKLQEQSGNDLQRGNSIQTSYLCVPC